MENSSSLIEHSVNKIHFVRQLLTQTLLISYPQWSVPGQDCVIEVQYRDGNKYCFLEFRTMEMAIAALQINDVTVLDTQLHVSRPTGFLDPAECEKVVKETEQELAKFRSGENDGLFLRQPGYTKLIAKIRSQQIIKGEQISDEVEKISIESSAYVCFENIITVSTLESNEKIYEQYNHVKSKIN